MATYDSIFYLTTFLFRLFRLLSVVLFFAVINNVEILNTYTLKYIHL